MAECLTFYFFIFSCFLPPTLFTSNHNKCKPLILTLFQSKSLSSILIGRMVLLGSFLFSSACSTLFAHFSLREVKTSHKLWKTKVACSLNKLLTRHVGWTMVQCTNRKLNNSIISVEKKKKKAQ